MKAVFYYSNQRKRRAKTFGFFVAEIFRVVLLSLFKEVLVKLNSKQQGKEISM